MKEKIILVDDDRMLLKSMQRVLEKEGYETAGVDNCEDALQLLKEDFYELVVTDIRMPGMDGIDFLERLRKVQDGKKKSHVIIITGYASEDVPVKAIKLNASDYLMKPFETDEFLYSIRKNMQIARLEKERACFVEELQETNRKLEESNRELEEAREKLVRKERLSAIGKLASGVGHELRNPLGSIKNVAFYLQNYVDIDDEDAKEYINTLSEEVNTADKILSDLLSFSRTITLNKSEFNFKKIIESSLKSVTIDENISVDVNVSGECEKGYGDPDKLKQVFKNLIDNAVQAIEEEGEIHINACKQENSCLIEVSDNGRGMDEKTRKNIFEPLFTTKAKGIGIGMSIVKDIIEHHDGSIEVDSEEEKGTTIKITLPLKKG